MKNFFFLEGMCMTQSAAMSSKVKSSEKNLESPQLNKKPRFPSSLSYPVAMSPLHPLSPALNGTSVSAKSYNPINSVCLPSTQISSSSSSSSSSVSSSSSSSTMNTNNSNFTPTRQSKRIASMTPVTSDDGRKRLRKT